MIERETNPEGVQVSKILLLVNKTKDTRFVGSGKSLDIKSPSIQLGETRQVGRQLGLIKPHSKVNRVWIMTVSRAPGTNRGRCFAVQGLFPRALRVTKTARLRFYGDGVER